MNILLVGSGGREHAIAWAIAASEQCKQLYCTPGNAGIKSCATLIDIAADNVEALTQFAKDNAIDLVIIGPEAPLVLGLADRLQKENILAFGPNARAAQLEGSKGFMKDLCAKYDIPTAAYGRFTDFKEAEAFINAQPHRLVIKADGLAAGKGVIICEDKDEALTAAKDMLENASFGKAGSEIIIEEFMDGEEVSYFALADGKTILPLSSAQDHKRAFDGDKGPNTGGMGAYSPAHIMDDALEHKIITKIIEPTIKAMAAENAPFTGVLYAGLMVKDGEPKLIEYNVRFGDPECQTLMMRLQGDLLKILHAGARGDLESVKDEASWKPQTALCVVMATQGYPAAYPKDTPIYDLSEAEKAADLAIFHAGTRYDEDGHLLSTGGRVLGITALGSTVKAAQEHAYTAVDKIKWEKGFCRRDIGWRAI